MDINPNVRNFYFLNQIFTLNTDLPTINEALLFKFNHILSVQNNLNAIEITQRDIIAFFIYFKNEHLLFDISRCVTQSFLSNSIGKYNSNIVNDTFLIKQFSVYLYLIIIINEQIKNNIHNKNNKLLFTFCNCVYHLIYKCYANKLLSKENMLIMFKLILYLGMTGDNDDKIENLLFIELYFKIINDLFLNGIFTTLNENKIQLITELLQLFNNIILSNSKNVYLLQHNTNTLNYFLKLYHTIYKTTINKNNTTLNNFISSYKQILFALFSYSFKYNNVMNLFIDIIKHSLFNLDFKTFDEFKHDLYLCNIPFEYIIENIVLYENNNLNQAIIKNGFIINNPPNTNKSIPCGIVSYFINKTVFDAFQIVFSFCISKSSFPFEQTLLFIKGEDDEVNWLKIYFISNKSNDNTPTYIMKVILKENEIVLSKNIYIKCDKHYVFSLVLDNRNEGEIKELYNSSSDNQQYSFTLNKASFKENSNKLICFIGCDSQLTKCTFNGIIGRIVLISKPFESKKQIEQQLNLKNTNDVMLFLNFLEIDSSYNNLGSYLVFPIHDCNIELNVNYKLFQFVPNSEDENYNNIIFMKNHKLQYTQENKQRFKKIKYNQTKRVFAFNSNFHIFNNLNPLEAFYNCNGIDFLILVLEYYYQLLIRFPQHNNNNTSISKEESEILINEYM